MTASSAIKVLPAAERGLRKVHQQIRGAVLKLATDPRPPGARALKDRPGFLRVRVGDYRIIYTSKDNVLREVVVRVGHLRDVYRSPTPASDFSAYPAELVGDQ